MKGGRCCKKNTVKIAGIEADNKIRLTPHKNGNVSLFVKKDTPTHTGAISYSCSGSK